MGWRSVHFPGNFYSTTLSSTEARKKSLFTLKQMVALWLWMPRAVAADWWWWWCGLDFPFSLWSTKRNAERKQFQCLDDQRLRRDWEAFDNFPPASYQRTPSVVLVWLESWRGNPRTRQLWSCASTVDKCNSLHRHQLVQINLIPFTHFPSKKLLCSASSSSIHPLTARCWGNGNVSLSLLTEDGWRVNKERWLNVGQQFNRIGSTMLLLREGIDLRFISLTKFSCLSCSHCQRAPSPCMNNEVAPSGFSWKLIHSQRQP